MMTRHLLLSLIFAPAIALAADDAVEHLNALAQSRGGTPIILKGVDTISTKAKFQPPVEITIEAKTDSTDLRVGYAADQVIFNWRDMKHQLRVDGGPANGKHKVGAGLIPVNKYMTIRWVVTPKKQTLYVDDELRFEHEGDYSTVNNPVSVFSDQSKISVKSIKVKKLAPDAN
jgi:hypothetical protein